MKYSLELKLGIAVVAVFGVLFIIMAMWKPFKVRYHEYRLESDDVKTRKAAAAILLDLDDKEHVFNY